MAGGEKSILIVDDEKEMCKTLKSILEAKGYDPEVAYNGLEAVELVGKKKFDIVLVDLVMPGMNGVEVVKKIRESKPDILLFIMTAFKREPLFEEALANGVLQIFMKPFDVEKMIETFDREIAKKNMGETCGT